jgi:hypothetical protein
MQVYRADYLPVFEGEKTLEEAKEPPTPFKPYYIVTCWKCGKELGTSPKQIPMMIECAECQQKG